MKFYAQFYSGTTGHWFTVGDEYSDMGEACMEIGRRRIKNDNVNRYRVVCYFETMVDNDTMPTDRLMD